MVGNLRSLPPQFWVLFAGTFVNRFGGFVVLFLVLYLTHLGYPPALAGLPPAAYGGGALIANLAGGVLADRIGRRATIVISMSGSAAAMIALSQARTLPLLILLAGAAGLAAELHRPASSALIADLVPVHARVTASAAYRLAINLGTAAGPTVAGLLAERSYTLLFAGDALTSLALAAAMFVPMWRSVPHRPIPAAGPPSPGVLRDGAFLALLLSSLLVGTVYLQYLTTFSLQVHRLGGSNALYGALAGLNGLLVVLFELPVTSITQRLPRRRVIAAGAVLVGIGYGTLLLVRSAPAMAICIVLMTAGEIVNAPVASAYVADLSPPERRGQYAGAFGVSWASASVIAAAGGTALYAVSPNLLWATCAALGLVAAAIVLLGPRPGPPAAGPS